MTNKKYIIISIISILLISIGVTYAYFAVQIEGESKNITVNMANMKVVFTDNNAINAEDIEPGEWNASKTFTVESQTDTNYTYNIVLKDFVNTFVTEGYLQYKITGTNGGYSTSGWVNVPKSSIATNEVLAYNVSLLSGVTHTYTLEFRYTNSESVDQSEDMGKILSGRLAIEPGSERPAYTLAQKILVDNNATVEANVPTRDSFDDIYKGVSPTLFKTNNAEHGDTVYYYAGNAVNNWVIFGSCPSNQDWCTEGDDLYWRIIRTNENATGGGVRLLYSGSGKKRYNGSKIIGNFIDNAYIGKSAFNAYDSNSVGYGIHVDRYVGYMYGTSGYKLANIRENTTDSTIKTVIDNWYEETFVNANSGLASKISTTAVYCNDRSGAVSYWNFSGGAYNQFGTYRRLSAAKAPSYACGANTSGYGNYFEGGNDKADKFSAEETAYGNGLLTYPVVLMTADEIAFAGGAYEANSPNAWYYANKEGDSITDDNRWWLLSPSMADNNYAIVFDVGGDDFVGGRLSSNSAQGSDVVRPSLTLISDTLASGTGTANDPYIVQ